MLCSHWLQLSERQYSFFSRSAKPAGCFKQLHNKLRMCFWMATEGIVFLNCSYFCKCTKNPLKDTVISTTALKNSFCSHYLRVLLAVLLHKILESWRVFKSVHHENVLWNCYVREIHQDFAGVFNKTIIPLTLVGYEMIIANSYPMRPRGIIVKYYVNNS